MNRRSNLLYSMIKSGIYINVSRFKRVLFNDVYKITELSIEIYYDTKPKKFIEQKSSDYLPKERNVYKV